jgi:hypothetical protein
MFVRPRKYGALKNRPNSENNLIFSSMILKSGPFQPGRPAALSIPPYFATVKSVHAAILKRRASGRLRCFPRASGCPQASKRPAIVFDQAGKFQKAVNGFE